MTRKLVLVGSFFVTLGLLSLAVAHIMGVSTTAGGALANLGVVFISIVMLEAIWAAIGGDPLRMTISSLDNKVESLSDTFNIIKDTFFCARKFLRPVLCRPKFELLSFHIFVYYR